LERLQLLGSCNRLGSVHQLPEPSGDTFLYTTILNYSPFPPSSTELLLLESMVKTLFSLQTRRVLALTQAWVCMASLCNGNGTLCTSGLPCGSIAPSVPPTSSNQNALSDSSVMSNSALFTYIGVGIVFSLCTMLVFLVNKHPFTDELLEKAAAFLEWIKEDDARVFKSHAEVLESLQSVEVYSKVDDMMTRDDILTRLSHPSSNLLSHPAKQQVSPETVDILCGDGLTARPILDVIKKLEEDRQSLEVCQRSDALFERMDEHTIDLSRSLYKKMQLTSFNELLEAVDDELTSIYFSFS
jgi:hypothetical protein